MKYLLLVIPLLLTLFLGVGVAKAQEDISPPSLLNVSFEPELIDTSKGPVTVTVSVHVTDDLSGVEWVALGFQKPGTTQQRSIDFSPKNGYGELLSGDELDGHYRATMTLPQYSAYGEWEMYYVALIDNVGNRSDQWKPDSEDESRGNDEWPSLYNGFVFAVGQEAPQQPVAQLFIPAILVEE